MGELGYRLTGSSDLFIGFARPTRRCAGENSFRAVRSTVRRFTTSVGCGGPGGITDLEWSEGWQRAMVIRLGGEALGELDLDWNPVEDDNLLLLFTAHHESIEFTLPTAAAGAGWESMIDTVSARPPCGVEPIAGGNNYRQAARSLALFREVDRRRKRRPG